MKKIDLITGFLGSGKTTFIKQYVKHLISKGEKVCILENDFGAVNVDMMLLGELRGSNCELEMVSGGCDRDCHKRRFKTKLIAMGMEDYTRIVIEPSGIFDVDELFDCLYDEPLCNWYEIGSVISIVDAKIDETLSNSAKAVLASEVALAGKIILSKTQLYDASDIEETKKYIKDVIRFVGCNRDIADEFIDKNWEDFSDADFEIISKSGYKKESYKKSLDDYEAFNTVCFLDEKLSDIEVTEFAKSLFRNDDKLDKFQKVFRVKGFCKKDDFWLEINADKNGISVKEINEGQDVLIVIGEKLDEDVIKDLLKKLRKPSKI